MKYVKMPVEMALDALRLNFVSQTRCYLTLIMFHSGKLKLKDESLKLLASQCEVDKRTIYRLINTLEEKLWISRNSRDKWLFASSINKVHARESWRFSRAVAIQKKDLKNLKVFLYATVITSLLKSESGQRSGRKYRGSEDIAGHISIKSIAKILGVSDSSAFRYRKKASLFNYIENNQDFRKVSNISEMDVFSMKSENIRRLKVQLFGSPDKLEVDLNRLVIRNSEVHLQLPNLIKSRLMIKYRKGCYRFDSSMVDGSGNSVY